MISWLDNNKPNFPPVHLASKEPNGLLAAGGDLSRDRLIGAYRHGIFPWYNPGEPILWWSPDPRTVLFPQQIHISKSMRKRLRRRDFTLTFDKSFREVITACAGPRNYTDASWITPAVREAYIDLHNAGIAHSVEVWINGELAGGLYGIAMGRIFFGESMFAKQPDASKIGFITLTEQLKRWGYVLIDCQVGNSHMRSLGSRDITRVEFIRFLNKYLNAEMEHEWLFSDLDLLLEHLS